MIHLEGISKSYKIAKRQTGLRQAAKALFHREYTTIEALKDISFSINQGEIVGYIGPNGAGKSTTIKVMSGILVPDTGSCTIMGCTPWKNRTHYVKNIGVVFGQRSQLWWDVPVMDSFELLKDIYKVPQQDYQSTTDLLIETLELQEIVHSPVRQLSLGQRMRCEIAASLIHHPTILFLDEPTIGLDAVSKIAVRQFIKTINQEKGVTVILTTHDMDDDDGAYTASSFQALQNAITAAEAAVSTVKTAEEVTAEAAALQAAIDGLEAAPKPVDVSNLENLLNTAKAISNDDGAYTASSFQALQDAIAAAEAAVSTVKTAEEVTVAVVALQAAIDV